MSKMYTGSICLTDILEKAKELHSAFKKHDNGKIYFNCQLWLNEEKDKYGNTISLQLNSTKEKKDVEPKFYIGNFKEIERKEGSLSPSDLNSLPSGGDLPF